MHTLRHAMPGGHRGLHQGLAAERVFPAAPVSVPAARRFVADTLASWGLGDVAGDSVQVAAELAANAVREGEHCALPEILLRLACGPRHVIVQAGDRNPQPPPRPVRRVRGNSEHGRGLTISRALSHRLAWYSDQDWKIVWASLAVPSEPLPRRGSSRPQLAGRQRWGRAA